MINDYFDLEGGVDTEDYVRAQYAPHPVLSGLISKTGLLLAIAVVNLLDLAPAGLPDRAARLAGGGCSRCWASSSASSTWRRRSSSSTAGSASRASSWSGGR